MSKSPEILAYITANKDRVLSGDPLSLYLTDENERKTCVLDLARALRANVVQLNNGDYILITNV
jgi:siroheme synthase